MLRNANKISLDKLYANSDTQSFTVAEKNDIDAIEYPLNSKIIVNSKTIINILNIIHARIEYNTTLLKHIRTMDLEQFIKFYHEEMEINSISVTITKEFFDKFIKEIIKCIIEYKKIKDLFTLQENQISYDSLIKSYQLILYNVELERRNILGEALLSGKTKKIKDKGKTKLHYICNDITMEYVYFEEILKNFQKLLSYDNACLSQCLQLIENLPDDDEGKRRFIINFSKYGAFDNYRKKILSACENIMPRISQEITELEQEITESLSLSAELSETLKTQLEKLQEIKDEILRLYNIIGKLLEQMGNKKIDLSYFIRGDQLIQALDYHKEHIKLIKNYTTEIKKINSKTVMQVDLLTRSSLENEGEDKNEDKDYPFSNSLHNQKEDDKGLNDDITIQQTEASYIKEEEKYRKAIFNDHVYCYNNIVKQKRQEKYSLKLSDLAKKIKAQKVEPLVNITDRRSFIIENSIILDNYKAIDHLLSTDTYEIKYDYFATLINRLGGKIVSNKGGSSHCKIMFQEELSSYVLDTVGGFVKPHGLSHVKPIYGFNLKLCKNAVEKILPENWRQFINVKSQSLQLTL